MRSLDLRPGRSCSLTAQLRVPRDVDDLPIVDGAGVLRRRTSDERGGHLRATSTTASTSATSTDLRRTASTGASTFVLLVVLQGFTGWTPASCSRHPLRAGGRPAAGFVKALVRWVLWIVDGFPYFIPLVGFIVGAHHRRPPPRRRHGGQDVRGDAAPRRARRSSCPASPRRPPAGHAGAWGAAAARPDRRDHRLGPGRPTRARPDGPAPRRAAPPPRRHRSRPTAPPVGRGARHLHPVGPRQGAWMQWNEGIKTWSGSRASSPPTSVVDLDRHANEIDRRRCQPRSRMATERRRRSRWCSSDRVARCSTSVVASDGGSLRA